MGRASGALGSVEEFLKRCQHSGDAAYAELRSLLELLEDPITRTETRIFLAELQRRFESRNASEQCLQTYHFQIQEVYLEQYAGFQKRKKLPMIVIPSIFMPEDWSFTFYEGLNRHPDSDFKDKIVAELGCGNGWISIAMAEKWLPSKVYGLDINPRAVKISWINLYLNALDEKGQPIYDQEKKTLLDRVGFHESDLLSYCSDNQIELERIVGCIPQILNPNPDAMSKIITENASEEFLHALSNYCALQGFVEDQFGLGLIARAVEEGISVMKPSGIMIFNMGGRPGQAVCKRLFERRGLHVNKLWQTKILQAPDTDIAALVEIEKNSPHRFEFFMGLAGDHPICARSAWAYAKAGGHISHALSVYSCQLRQPTQVKKIFKFLENGFDDVSSSLDLSFEDDSVADEKIPFLAYLADVLKEISFFPYEPPAGSRQLRSLIARFMKTYHHIPLHADNVVIFPSRTVAIESALLLLSPQLAIVDEQLSRHLPRQWITSLNIEKKERGMRSAQAITVIEAPCQSDLMIEMIKKLKPEVVFTGIAQFESVTSSSFEHLLNVTKEIGCRLFLDISDHFELSSLPCSNGVFKYLAGNTLPSHAAVVCGLLKNQVYSDLEVAFVISEEETMFKALCKTVELLQGNTSIISQYYYRCIFHELLAFQLTDRHMAPQRICDNQGVDDGFASSTAFSILDHAELAVDDPDGDTLVHMDVDQSFLPISTPVKAAIFESFARQNITEPETDIKHGIQQLIYSNYGFPANRDAEFIYADSVVALLSKLILCCIHEGATLFFPTGSNGNYVSAAKFLNANVVSIPTDPEHGYKLTEKTLARALDTVAKPWIYISGPTISPTGLLYSNDEIDKLLSVCAKSGARVILDTSFSGAEFDSEEVKGWNLEPTLAKLSSTNSNFCVFLLGGLFNKMLSVGIGFGFLVIDRPSMAETFRSFGGLSKPHSTVKYAVKNLLDLREKKTTDLSNAISKQTEILRSRYKQLKQMLESCGWEVLGAQSGISVVAKPAAYLGKPVRIMEISGDGMQEMKVDESNIREAVVRSTGLLINSPAWTGIPGYCRFTVAVEDREFERALDCILKFKSFQVK
ncbi:methionine S-methyltransferase-like [Andrographis paniculata]|uniref:methionine S-methyltransferase-like n=1 Tax=Andrographis paniculata TaxID=175694 RepID=UPI0021E8BE1D|nr:methionine S-methyltransferase-like [Andrographis paniculata]